MLAGAIAIDNGFPKEAVEELGGDPEDYTYGIMRSDGSPRPAFEALKRLAINKDLFRF